MPQCLGNDRKVCGKPDCQFCIELRESQKALQEGDVEKATDLIIRHTARAQAGRIRKGRVQNG